MIDPFDEYETNTYCGSFLEEEFDKHAKEIWGVDKWNLIIQNPPYQQQKEGFKKTQPLWHLFVQKSLSLVVENGYMVMVHPSGWRNVDGIFKETQRKLKENQILELHIHNESDGSAIFGATTGYDYYIMKNSNITSETSIYGGQEFGKLQLSDFEFVPSSGFKLFSSLIAKNQEEKVSILYSRSEYGTDKGHMSRFKSDENPYPCVYTIPKNGIPNFFFSAKKGVHFGLPKVIWSNGKASLPIVDYNGEYGLTQFSYGIVDSEINLFKIQNAMRSKEFINLMKHCDMNDGNRFNKKVLSSFKKDFWKYFYKDDGLRTKCAHLIGYMLKVIKSGTKISKFKDEFDAIKHSDFDEFIKRIKSYNPNIKDIDAVVYNNGEIKTNNFSQSSEGDFIMMFVSGPFIDDFYKRCLNEYGNIVDVDIHDVVYRKLAMFEIIIRMVATNNGIHHHILKDVINDMGKCLNFNNLEIEMLHIGREFLNKVKHKKKNPWTLFDFERSYNLLYEKDLALKNL